ncbi:MAG TPA: response regulator [Actinomycetota bacterium]
MADAPRLLLVDDDPVILRLLQVNFRLEGYEIDTAADGALALASAQERPPDIVVLDMMLPDLPGEEVCRRMRTTPELAEVPVIFLTGRTEGPDPAEAGLGPGPVDLIAKPFDPADVVEVVRRRLEERTP